MIDKKDIENIVCIEYTIFDDIFLVYILDPTNNDIYTEKILSKKLDKLVESIDSELFEVDATQVATYFNKTKINLVENNLPKFGKYLDIELNDDGTVLMTFKYRHNQSYSYCSFGFISIGDLEILLDLLSVDDKIRILAKLDSSCKNMYDIVHTMDEIKSNLNNDEKLYMELKNIKLER